MFLNRFTLLALLLFTTFISTIQGQERSCSTMELHEQKMEDDPVYRKNYLERQQKFQQLARDRAAAPRYTLCPDPVLVPMAVHYDGVPGGYDEQCMIDLALDQIQILNDDFQGLNADITNWINNSSNNFPGVNYAESCMQFCLATMNHPSGYGLVDGDYAITYNQITGADGDWAGYINIFVRNIGALGFSPLGGNGNGDGVTVDNNAFGAGAGCSGFSPNAPYDLGRTLTHELGHYLNLPHIWGGGCSSDDGISDTPDQDDPNYGCPGSSTSSCGSLDLHMNYMDYTNDACMYMFSAGQQSVMENYLAANLNNVTNNSAACVPPTPQIAFAAAQTSVTEGSSSCATAGTQSFTVDMTISAAPSATATVFLAASGSALNGTDFTISPTTLNFPAGQTDAQSITVTIMEDGIIEGDESFMINYTLNPNGGDAEAGTTNQSFVTTILDDDVAPTAGFNTIELINQDFNAGIAPFTVVDGGSNNETWKLSSGSDNLDGSPFIICDSDAAGNGSTTNESLLSPVFNGAQLMNLTLDFDQFINVYTGQGDFDESFAVDIFDGSNWINVYTHLESDGDLGSWDNPNHQTIDLSAYAATNNQLRFVYIAEYDWWWALDNIVVSGDQMIGIQTATNAGNGFSEREFGPFTTLYFYDENSGDVMLKLINNTSHDYGCTTVYVERSAGSAGAVQSNAPESEWITEKTFRVVPEFNDPNGSFTVDLYYTAAEISGWEAASGATATELQMVKSQADIATATNLEVAAVTVDAFGDDFIYSATYSSGFSGFALGGAAALPVEWLGISAQATQKSISVEWSTSSERNNEGFSVLRRAPGETRFSRLGWVAGAGDSDGQQSYRWEDATALAGVRYDYQIQQRDFDGQTSLSPIANARIETDELVVRIFPVPVNDLLNVAFIGEVAGAYELINASGIRLISGQFADGFNRLRLDVAHLPAGLYWLRLNTPRERKVLKVIVK